jgi:hypothetical protein
VPGFADAARWQNSGVASAELHSGPDQLGMTLGQTTAGGPWPTLQSADVPGHLPAVIASGTASVYPGVSAHDISSFGLDERPVMIDGRFQSVTLPQLDRFGVLVDFELALKAMTDSPAGPVNYQVWLASGAPSDMAARLARQGVTVTGTVRAADFRRELDHTGPALAEALFLVGAVVAIVLAIGAALLGGATTARRRAYEVAALEAAGVPGGALRRALTLEQAVLLGLGLVVGLGAGLGGSALALPSTPFFVDETVGPPVARGLPLALVGALAGILLVVFALTSAVIAWLITRQATAARLREAQQ